MMDCFPPRRPDWRPRLQSYLARVSGRRFRAGRHDCALFAAGAIHAQTGFDPAHLWRGQYRNLDEGYALLRGAGFEDPAAFVAARCEEIAPARAAAGDIAVLAGDDGTAALGVVQGAMVYCLRPSGLALVRRDEILKAFRL